MHTPQTLIRFILALLIAALNACAPIATQTNVSGIVNATTPTRAPTVAASTTAATGAPTTAPTVAPPATSTPSPYLSDTAIFAADGAFFALSVTDARAASQWYQEKFGLHVVLATPKSNQSTVIVLEGGGLIVELIQNDNAKPLTEIDPTLTNRALVHGILKVGLIVDDFDQTVSTLRARGVKFVIGPFPKSSTQRANLIIEDNEGNLIQFFGN